MLAVLPREDAYSSDWTYIPIIWIDLVYLTPINNPQVSGYTEQLKSETENIKFYTWNMYIERLIR